MAKRWMRLDPSRTKSERQRFMREIKRRFGQLSKALWQFLVTEDAFGLEPKLPGVFNSEGRVYVEMGDGTAALTNQGPGRERLLMLLKAAEMGDQVSQVAENLLTGFEEVKLYLSRESDLVLHHDGTLEQVPGPVTIEVQNRRQYAFLSDPDKVKQFQVWLKRQIDAGVFSAIGGLPGKPWTADYIESAWRKGLLRAYTDVRKQNLSKSPEWYRGTKEQFLISTFGQPEVRSKIELLALRAFEGMKGITEQMSTQMSRILADGLVNGYGPKKIAKLMTDSMGRLTRTRALVIARTEIIHAHAEGQLDGYSALGIQEVGAEVEWSTARDALVCEKCAPLEGKVYTIKQARGLIPLHPNCRCAWKPHVETRKRKGS